MLYDEDSLLALSGIQHYAFCPRQWALIHVERQWIENVRTVEGKHLHRRVHEAAQTETRGEVIYCRSLPLVSYTLGLYGVADLVEFHRDSQAALGRGVELPAHEGAWFPKPIEYKRGRPKKDDRDKVQLCAQAMCMEEMFNIEVSEGSLFYGQTRHRTDVVFTKQLRERVASLAADMHEAFDKGITPAAPQDARCKFCSLKEICIPRLTRKRKRVARYITSWTGIGWGDD